MTVRNGGGPRSGKGGGPLPDQARRPVVDMGWDDFEPPAVGPGPRGRSARSAADTKRDYRSGRWRGPGHVVRFAIFALVLGGLVTAGLYFVARPIVVGGIVDWAAENPTALSVPFVADVVRSELGSGLTKPVDAHDQSAIVIVIDAGETPREIADQLATAGVIANARAFVFQAIQRNVTSDFQIGRHVVSKSLTVDQIISLLIKPPVAPPTVRITFREGLRIEQMVAKLELLESNPADPTAALQMNVAQFYQLALNPPADLLAAYPWLKLPAGASLEGFLFPATYNVAPDTTPIQLLGMLLDAFANHAPPDLLKLPPDQIYQKVQIAALVESEAKVDSDRALIAGVYVNRLNPKIWPTGLLNANPTLNYANDSLWLQDPAHPIASWVDYTFWTSIKAPGALSKVVFPGKLAGYNTYSHAGLPPAPICSPSGPSLVAAMTPDTADGYLYFLAKNDGSGTHAFAKTQAEQDANAKKYGYTQ
jgi:UPF0755 protein